MKTTPDSMLTVVSRSFAPQVSASAIVLCNLLSEYDAPLTAITTYHRYTRIDPEFVPPCRTTYLKLPRLLSPAYFHIKNRLINGLSWSLKISIQRQLLKNKAEIVMGLLPHEELFVPAFWRLSLWASHSMLTCTTCGSKIGRRAPDCGPLPNAGNLLFLKNPQECSA